MDGLLYFPQRLGQVLLPVGSGFSLSSLAAALVLAVLFVVYRRRRKNRVLRAWTVVRALFPKRITRSESCHADIAFFGFNIFVYGLAFGWAVASYKVLSNTAIETLTATFGTPAPSAWPSFLVQAVLTVVLFLAYEFGYWFDHYLKHRVPALWELHKVHHSANVLTPLTTFRMHPLDGVIFANILAVALGVTHGLASYAFGRPASPFTIDDSNLILVAFVHIYVHLQHTHLWIAFTGMAGRVFMSPAHHQIHHSNNPIHFDKNLGSCLAIWDWLFGTLYIPKREPEKVAFGVAAGQADAHSPHALWVAPVQRAAGVIAAQLGSQPVEAPDASVAPPTPAAPRA